MSFKVRGQWGRSFPHFSRPEINGYFSLNGKREFSHDLSQLKYFSAPKQRRVEFDLKKGYESVCRKSRDADERLDHLLRWILKNINKIRAPTGAGRWLQPEFICYRGLLGLLWCTPFERQEGWLIYAAKWRGTIYLYAFSNEEKKEKEKNLSEAQLQFMSWGYKFEQYMVTDSPDKPPDTSQPVNEAEEFACVFQSRFGDSRLLYGAEMDGVCSNKVLEEPINWKEYKMVELKTSRIIQSRRQDQNFKRFKLIKWWSQSFLAGIETIVCGFRDDEGIVRELRNYNVSEIPKMSEGMWNASTCMNFCNEFLRFIKSVVRKDQNECIYKFDWTPGDDIRVEELQGPSEYSLLPQWYFDQAEAFSPHEIL